jgi:hypothetical protein
MSKSSKKVQFFLFVLIFLLIFIQKVIYGRAENPKLKFGTSKYHIIIIP